MDTKKILINALSSIGIDNFFFDGGFFLGENSAGAGGYIGDLSLG